MLNGSFDRLTVLSRVEGLTTLSKIEGPISVRPAVLTDGLEESPPMVGILHCVKKFLIFALETNTKRMVGMYD